MLNVNHQPAPDSIAPRPALPAVAMPAPAKVSPELTSLIAAWKHAKDVDIEAYSVANDASVAWYRDRPFITAKIGSSHYEIGKSDTTRAIREQHKRLLPAHDLPEALKLETRRFAWRQARQWHRNVRDAEAAMQTAYDAHPHAALDRHSKATGRKEIAAMKAVLNFPARTDADCKALGAFIREHAETGMIDDTFIQDIAKGMMAGR